MVLTCTYHACAHDWTRAFRHTLRTRGYAWASYTEIRCKHLLLTTLTPEGEASVELVGT
jgi:hypothetical protein